MSSIKFLLQSKKNPAQIYLRLSLGRGKIYKKKTGYTVNPKEWSKNTGYPKTTYVEGKKLKLKLKNLENFIFEQSNKDIGAEGVEINSNWLEEQINIFNNNVKPKQLDYLVDYGREFISKLPDRVYNGKRGASGATITKYNTIVKKLESYEKQKNKRLVVKDIDLNFRDSFIKYLIDFEKINENTAGRYVNFLKTILIDARKNGIKTNHQIDDFKGYSLKTKPLILTFEELDKIKAEEYEGDLEIARDWLLIGCYTGQRVSDLLRMNKSMIKEVQGYRFIELTQKKTGKLVQIPIHDEVEKILQKYKDNFPPVFAEKASSNSTLFNKHLKLVCKKAKINEKVEGSLYNHETERNEIGKYEKYKLISSHTCRRSFCTNFYALQEYPTPLLMAVSGHQTEKMFLVYIGKEPLDYGLELARIWANNKK